MKKKSETNIKTNMDMVRQIWEQIDLLQYHYNAVQSAMFHIQTMHGPDCQKTFSSDLLDALNRKELDAWRTLFMFALTLPQKERDRVKAAAYEKFLNKHTSVASYMNNFHGASSWACEEEEEFRANVEKLFAPEKENERK